MKPATRRRKTNGKTSDLGKPYMKTREVKGLYAPAEEAEIAAEGSVTPTLSQGLSFASSMGGIDGIISMMGKAQQMFKLFQQMGPMFKLLNSFGGAKALTASLRKSRGHHLQLNKRKAYKLKKPYR